MPAKLLHPNLARDPAIRKQVEDELVPLVKRVRTDRNTLRETWLRYYRLWSCTRDQQAYKGRSQTFIPIGRRIIENHVKRIKRDLFPPDTAWDVRARRQVFEERVNTVKGLFGYFFEKHTRLRRNATPWIRQLVTLGTSPVKVIWQLDERTVRFLEAVVDEEGKLTKRWTAKEDAELIRVGPTFRPVDLFAFYVYPVTVADVDDADLAFEDMLVDRARVRALGEKTILPDDQLSRDGITYGHVYEHLDELWENVNLGDQKDKVNAEARRLADKGFTHPLDMQMAKDLRPVDLTECLWSRRLEGDAPKNQRYLITLGADDVVLRVQRNPFLHNRSHWLCGKLLEVENEFYGRGLPEVFDKLQYFTTDIADQGSDALVWSCNPIAVVDVFGVQDPTSLRMRPGAKWLAAKGSVEFKEPPKESAAVAFNMMGQTIALIRDFADVSPLPGNVPRGRGRSQQTASGAQLMVSEAQVDVREVVENLEDQVMVPFLYRCHALTEQFLDRQLLLQIAGADGAAMIEQPVGVEDITGDYEFVWLGSLRAQNEQVRAQQLIQGMGLLTKLPADQLAAQNVEIDWKYLLREVFGTGLGIRNPERIIADKVRQTSVDWRIENELFRVGRGREVVVAQADNDEEHAKGHQRMLEEGDLPAGTQALIFGHLQAHVAAHLAKQQLRQQQAMQQAQRQQAPAGGGGNGGGNGNGLGTPMAGGRLAQTNDMGDLLRRLPRLGG